MTAIIEVSHLVKMFGDHAAVNDVSLSVEKGEVFGLLGPNGAGKSTTIKMLTTLLSPSSGRASVNGFDIVQQTTAVRHSLGYVPQALSADGNLTGFENLLIFAKLYDVPRAIRTQRINEVLSYVGLLDVGKQLVRTYSGGMIRRLEVAQSLLHQPSVLFLDEPTVGLDPIARQAIWDHLMDLRADSNMTIFVTTHSMEEADSLCTRIGIMHRGQIAVIGTPAELKANIGIENATLDDVFVHYAGDALESGGSYREASRARRTARRLG
ncbi:ATP-binding cassette domain-containing protein [Dictyobacter arantiisoli]|uniref:Multidrug ABC transporter ATP-binding protein n=1 Tax=Dictyobacter arantiisoli TaxID=2014874 RepID=A0A5A5TJX8_9CHLR|nr:ATP-binding cassette domain-containing protein [Dictyobacter arantiisoli]GCF11592.1 multidrug ABC transporter ATP-binding protein [Dictyobacter arantiisoli]